MTRSLQLPYWAYVTAFLQTDLFLDYLFRKKQSQFRYGDPMTSASFLVIGHRAPVGVSLAGNSI